MKIAVVGATGLVGIKMLKKLEESPFFTNAEVIAAASKKSAGKKLEWKGKDLTVYTVEEALAEKPILSLFSAGAELSGGIAPRFAENGFVVDNSSFWRMYDEVPLVVPEINADAISSSTRIIANPNCSTIQMVLVLSGLHKRYGIRRIVVSTYQSVSGSGIKGIHQLNYEEASLPVVDPAYLHPIYLNLIPHGGSFLENGYTTEEMKLVNETRKILNDQSIQITAIVVRVPVKGGHSEAVNVELLKDFDLEEVRKILKETPGVVVLDNPTENIYPMPLFAEGKDEVFVGRIRRDESQPKSLNLWIVADNLLKGAATNAVQIGEAILKKGLIF